MRLFTRLLLAFREQLITCLPRWCDQETGAALVKLSFQLRGALSPLFSIRSAFIWYVSYTLSQTWAGFKTPSFVDQPSPADTRKSQVLPVVRLHNFLLRASTQIAPQKRKGSPPHKWSGHFFRQFKIPHVFLLYIVWCFKLLSLVFYFLFLFLASGKLGVLMRSKSSFQQVYTAEFSLKTTSSATGNHILA